MTNDLQDIYSLERTIQGNISRLCVTDNPDELITRIYEIACNRKRG